MREPLKPVFTNQRARIREHQDNLNQAMNENPGKPICPDCYQPPERCPHWRPKR